LNSKFVSSERFYNCTINSGETVKELTYIRLPSKYVNHISYILLCKISRIINSQTNIMHTTYICYCETLYIMIGKSAFN